MAVKRLDLTDSVGFELPWTAEDSAEWRNFLTTRTGRRMLGRLMFKRPTCSERSDAFKRGIQSGIVEGYEEAVHVLGFLANSEKSVTKDK